MKEMVKMPSKALCSVVWQRFRAAFLVRSPLFFRTGRSPFMRCAAAGAALALLPLVLEPLVLVPLATAQAPVPARSQEMDPYAPVSGPDLGDYVSPNLDPAEQVFMRTYMNSFPRDVMERIIGQPLDSISVAIVDGATGIIHYNRPEDVGSYEVVSGFALPGDEHPDAQSAVQNPGVYAGSGPYRRIYTVPLPAAPAPHPDEQGNYEQSGVVTTGCKAGNFAKGDQGYAYLGGWSGSWNSSGTPGTVDAGLVYNYEASDASDDDYSVFMNLGKGIGLISKGNGENGAGKPLYPQPTHIACSSFGLARLNFSVFGTHQLRTVAPKCWTGTGTNGTWIGFPNPACSTYALMLSVTSEHFKTFSGAHTGFIVWVSPTVTAGGWAHLVKFTAAYWNGKYNVPGYIASATCADCMFKWMTSIAQSKGNTLADGSHYSAAWFKREISGYALNENYDEGAALTTLTEGITDCSEYPLWHPPYSTDYQADCTNSPSGLKGTAQTVEVKDYVPEGEWDIIAAKY